MKNKEENVLKNEAKTLISYVRHKYKKPRFALLTLGKIMTGDSTKLDKVEQDVAKFVADRTSYIMIDKNPDVDVEEGEWGIPHIISSIETFYGVSIQDKENLITLRREVDNILNRTAKKISNFVSKTDKPKWNCQKCGRFLGKELSSTNEVQELLDDFSVGKYWKCRLCDTQNYFSINSTGIKFKKI